LLSNYVTILYAYGPVFLDTDCRVATIVMESAQLVLSQFKKFNVVN